MRIRMLKTVHHEKIAYEQGRSYSDAEMPADAMQCCVRMKHAIVEGEGDPSPTPAARPTAETPAAAASQGVPPAEIASGEETPAPAEPEPAKKKKK